MTARELVDIILSNMDEEQLDMPITANCHECGLEQSIEGIEQKSKHIRIY